MQVRKFQKRDLSEIKEVFTSSFFKPDERRYAPPHITKLEEDLREDDCVVAENGSTYAGLVLTSYFRGDAFPENYVAREVMRQLREKGKPEVNPSDKVAYFHCLGVEPRFREKGIGTLLVSKAIEQAREKEASLGIVECVESSRSLFMRNGFTPFYERYTGEHRITYQAMKF